MNKVLICILFLIPAFGPKEAGNPAITRSSAAIDVTSQCIEAYRGLDNYLDSGKVITEISTGGRSNKTSLHFKTAYSKKGGFNFEFYHPGQSNSLYTINRSKGKAQSWWGINGQTKTNTLPLLLAAAYGVSSRSSKDIPTLLLTEIFPDDYIFRQVKLELDKMETLNGVPCYLMTRLTPDDEVIRMWIAQKDFLIRKIERTRDITTQNKHMHVIATTFYEVSIPKTIDQNLLSFRPDREVAL